MITANDLLLWANAGTLPEPEPVVVPPAPNLRGDEVRYVRKNDAGEIIGYGHAHREHVEAEIASGANTEIIDHDAPEPVLPSPGHSIDPEAIVRDAIDAALDKSDHYFLADRAETIDAAKQRAWTAYRAALRAARGLDNAAAMVAALPVDPKGRDLFAGLRPAPADAKDKPQ